MKLLTDIDFTAYILLFNQLCLLLNQEGSNNERHFQLTYNLIKYYRTNNNEYVRMTSFNIIKTLIKSYF